MDVRVLRFPDNVGDWDLVVDFLRLRTDVFVGELGWSLPTHRGLEFEQYDSFQNVVYVLAVDQGSVVAGGRLVRTDAMQPGGCYTYMIKDAHDGRLPGMPAKLCFDAPPTDPEFWELTRIAAPRSRMGARRVCAGVNDFLKGQGAKHCLGLGAPSLMKLMGLFGYRPEPIGEVVQNGDGSFLAFQCEVLYD